MKAHLSTIVPRMIRAALRVKQCRYRIVAVGIDNRNRIISIATNAPRLPLRGLHAEERVIHMSPRSLRRIMLLRVGSKGNLLKIDPCRNCQRLADKRRVSIERISP